MKIRSAAIAVAVLASGCSQGGEATSVTAAEPAKVELPIKGEGIGDPCRIANILQGDLSIHEVRNGGPDDGVMGYLLMEVDSGMRGDVRYPVIRAILGPEQVGYFRVTDPWGEHAFDVEGVEITPSKEGCGSWTTNKIEGEAEGRWSIKRDGQQVAVIQGEWPPKF